MEPTTLTAVLAMVLLGVGAAVWRLPVGTCPECEHCRIERLNAARERAERTERDLSQLYGIRFCTRCGRDHPPDGRQCD